MLTIPKTIKLFNCFNNNNSFKVCLIIIITDNITSERFDVLLKSVELVLRYVKIPKVNFKFKPGGEFSDI